MIIFARKLMIIMSANLLIKLIKNKFMDNKMDSVGITSYYQNLPHGTKDDFARQVAEAIGQATASVYRKLRVGGWSPLELREINSIIAKHRTS